MRVTEPINIDLGCLTEITESFFGLARVEARLSWMSNAMFSSRVASLVGQFIWKVDQYGCSQPQLYISIIFIISIFYDFWLS